VKTTQDYMRAAFAALLRGDTAERDRLCKMAEQLIRAQDRMAAGGPIIEGEAIEIRRDVIALPDRSREALQ
jgi:hypothetical protein